MKEIDEYIKKNTWRINENSNTNYSLSGLKNHLSATFLAKDSIANMPELARQYHINGAIHCHDLDGGRFAPYCIGNDLLKLLQTGIKTLSSSSAPSRHMDVAIDHLVNMTYVMTLEWNGAMAWRDFDILMAPFVWYDNLSYQKIKQNIQRLVYNLSYPLRAAYQSPFTNLTFALEPPSYYIDKDVIIGGKQLFNLQYGDLQNEIDMINMAFCDVMLEGDIHGNPHTFPLPTYNITPDFDWDSKVANKIFEMTAKFGTPYFANYINTDYLIEDSVSMCCRLKLDTSEIQKITGGIWNYGANTGSLAVCTINLAQIGYITKNDLEFKKRLDLILESVKEYLLWKKIQIKDAFKNNLLPVSKNYVHTLDTFFLTVGIIGLNEASMNLYGKNIIENSDWCEYITKYIGEKVHYMQKETGHLFNFEATPAEGATYRLAKIDKLKFSDIITQGTIDAPYYTGSNMIPVNYDISLPDALRHQEKMQQYFTGGSIFHIHVNEKGSKDGIKELIKKVCTNTKLPYISYSPIFSICEEHGQHFGKDGICPICGTQNEILSRVVGYYRPVNKFNIGKKQEFRDRINYTI